MPSFSLHTPAPIHPSTHESLPAPLPPPLHVLGKRCLARTQHGTGPRTLLGFDCSGVTWLHSLCHIGISQVDSQNLLHDPECLRASKVVREHGCITSAISMSPKRRGEVAT